MLSSAPTSLPLHAGSENARILLAIFFGHWKITTRESKPNNNDAMFADYDVGSLRDLVAMFFNVSSQNFYSA